MASQGESKSDAIKKTLEPVLQVLGQLGGYFTFSDQAGRQFVIARREDFHVAPSPLTERQLTLPPAPSGATPMPAVTSSADDVLERINREIASYQLQQQEEEMRAVEDLVAEESVASSSPEPLGEEIDDLGLNQPKPLPGARVRFEPLKGDLPPDLQE